MELLPLGVGAAVGAGAGLIDRNAASLEPKHVQLLYRAGGLAAALYAQSKRLGPPNLAPALVTAMAASLSYRATDLLLAHELTLGEFGMTSAALVPDRLATPTAAGSCACGMRH